MTGRSRKGVKRPDHRAGKQAIREGKVEKECVNFKDNFLNSGLLQ